MNNDGHFVFTLPGDIGRDRYWHNGIPASCRRHRSVQGTKEAK